MDEPLRDDEKLFAPKPYSHPGPVFRDSDDQFQSANMLKSSKKKRNGKELDESPKKTKKTKSRLVSVFEHSRTFSKI